MPEYQFGEHQKEKPKKAPQSNQNGRTIPVYNGEISFDLGSKPATVVSNSAVIEEKKSQEKQTPTPSNKLHFPDKKLFTEPPVPAKVPKKSIKEKLVTHFQKFTASKPSEKPASHSNTPTSIITKFWHALEFVAVTAAIFMVLFFFINYQSYSQLLLTKLDLLKNQLNQNPYTQQEAVELKNASPEGQKPLPIVNSPQAAKKQVPALTMEIAPPDERVIIPRIGQNVPIVQIPTDTLLRRDWSALEKQIQNALREGVVHFPGTAYPGEPGNVVITGHSSYFPWDPGRFKDVFALLHQVNVGDQIIVYHDQKKYTYEVYEKKVVKPTEISVLTQEGDTRLTLITCTPVGTDLNRLVVLAKPVSVT